MTEVKQIWKFPLRITDRQSVLMPEDAKILSVQFQGDQLVMWALCSPQANHTYARLIDIFGTGHPVDDTKRDFIGTAQQPNMPLVWHVFEVVKERGIKRPLG